MRKVLCQSLVDHAARPDFVFLTGDLGFNALEPLRDRMGPRFLNAGVAEQNMICVAAGVANVAVRRSGYTTAPPVFWRPLARQPNHTSLSHHSLALLLSS